jgi:chromate reductase
MSNKLKVAVIIGSLRKGSFSRKLALAMIAIGCDPLEFDVIEIGQLPLFNQDDEASPSPIVVDFKHRVAACDAVLFVTPEYNRSVPGVLKNAIDVGSRPYGQSAWDRKPGAVVSVSPGALGAFGANHHLRQSMVFLNVPMMPQPEAYIGNVKGLFDDKGALVSDPARDLLGKFLQAFARWIERKRVH